MADTDELQEMFFIECDELLDGLTGGLRQMDRPGETGAQDMECVHAVFRAVHSIKGGAAAFGLSELVTFAHRFETVLDRIRSDRLVPDPQIMAVLHRASDTLADLVGLSRQGGEGAGDQTAEILAALDQLIPPEEGEGSFTFTPVAITLAENEAPAPCGHLIHFFPGPDLYRSGNDPLALLQALGRLGEMQVRADTESIAPLAEWSPEACRLGWTITLHGETPASALAEVFEFVEGACTLSIEPLTLGGAGPLPAAFDPPQVEASPRIGHAEAIASPDAPLTGPSPPPIALLTQKPTELQGGPASEAGSTIRVNLQRVDRLMNMIGELVIKEAMLSQVIDTVGLAENLDVAAGLDGIRQLADEIQDSVMAIRAQPLKLVFQRMHRILREASEATGKPVRLITLGEQTEVDKTMIERLVDPLTHMIRNAVDHGLEDRQTRRRRAKPVEGTITLSAAHRSGRVQIELSDDGGGIDRTRVREIAEKRGLIAPGAMLTAAEIDQLLFLPGFSSKQEVSALSGRGVGLDVVRREIMALGGRVTIQSTEGRGTTFSIALPLTLAVLEGMLIQLGDQTMVLPITSVQETLRPLPSALHGIGPTGRVVANRGDLIPIIDLDTVFGLRSRPAPLDQGVLIVVETDSQKRAALHVDGIVDQRQVVIKSIEENYGRVPGVSAATILGDGKIALIVDPEEIVLSCTGDAGLAPRLLSASG